MTAKRFHYDRALEHIYDYDTCEDGIAESLDCFDACELLNELNDKCNFLEIENESLEDGATRYAELYHQSLKESEQLKSTIKEVIEILVEEVDVFSEEATEYVINAYLELKELDNKDAFYMAIATKEAIKMLKELMMND